MFMFMFTELGGRPLSQIDVILKENGLKSTKSRKLILDILERAQEPMSAEEIFINVRHQDELDFSTVYRTLSTFTQKLITLKNIEDDGKSYYQLNNHKHSHYLVCSECRKRILLDSCPLEEMTVNLEKKTGFHISGHNLEFIGECPECLENEIYKVSK